MTKIPLRVDVDLSIDQVWSSMDPKGDQPKNMKGIEGVALDSRVVKKGDLFFALEGATNGHQYVHSAFENGAIACVVHEDIETSGPLFRVSDTAKALGWLARDYRRRWGKSVAAITGSNGKTTTKEIVSGLLSAQKRTLKTPGSWNTKLSVPLTILQLRDHHDVAVLEMGISDFGELDWMCEIASPTIGLITNISAAHVEFLKDIEGVARAKGELFRSLGKDDTAVINIDDVRVAKLAENLQCKKITASTQKTANVVIRITEDLGQLGFKTTVKYGDESCDLKIPFLGEHNVQNTACAIAVAYAAGVPLDQLQKGLDAVTSPDLRMEIDQLPNGTLVIQDCYNANPVSMAEGLKTAKRLARGRTLAVLGDMKELGDSSRKEHEAVGALVAKLGYDELHVIGEFGASMIKGAVDQGFSKRAATEAETHEDLVSKILNTLDERDTILLKGSRGMEMERIVTELRKNLSGEKN